MLFFAAFTVLMMACGQSGNDKDANAGSQTASNDAAEGEKIYKQYCVTCHGLYGDMGASGAFNLKTSTLSVEEKVGVITNGRINGPNVMTPFKDLLSEEQIKAVATYTMKLKE